jgi:hypothetical protein
MRPPAITMVFSTRRALTLFANAVFPVKRVSRAGLRMREPKSGRSGAGTARATLLALATGAAVETVTKAAARRGAARARTGDARRANKAGMFVTEGSQLKLF